MILDAIYNGDFRPGETGFMDREDYREAMRAAELFRVQLMESMEARSFIPVSKRKQQSWELLSLRTMLFWMEISASVPMHCSSSWT